MQTPTKFETAVNLKTAKALGLDVPPSYIAGPRVFIRLKATCGDAMRGAVALPGSKATSRAKGSHRNLGGLGSDHRCRVSAEYGGPHREGEEP